MWCIYSKEYSSTKETIKLTHCGICLGIWDNLVNWDVPGT